MTELEKTLASLTLTFAQKVDEWTAELALQGLTYNQAKAELAKRLRNLVAEQRAGLAESEEINYFFDFVERETIAPMEAKVMTRVYVYDPADALRWRTKEYMLDSDPEWKDLKPIFEEWFGKSNVEHVNVLFDEGNRLHAKDGKMLDMFVDEDGYAKDLELNPQATVIYWAAYKRRHGKKATAVAAMARDLPPIVGRAIVFNRKVWN